MTDPDQPPSAPEVEHLAATLQARRAELAHAPGARIGQGRVVHALTTRIWVGLQVPAVLCAAAGDPLRLRPAWEPVTCRRCRARTASTAAEQTPGQQRLL